MLRLTLGDKCGKKCAGPYRPAGKTSGKEKHNAYF